MINTIMEKMMKYRKNALAFFMGLVITMLVVFTISYRNINYQAQATIDYIYAVETGGTPELADTWLAEKYCNNKIALEIAYPEMKEKCEIIKHETKLNDIEK